MKLRLGQVLSALAGLVILIGLFAHFGITDVVAALERATPSALLLYLALSLLILWAFGMRWHRIAATLGTDVPLRRLLVVRVVSDAVSSLFPPGRLTGDSLRVGLLHAGGTPGATAGAGVMLDRFCEAAGNLLAAVTYTSLVALNSSGHAVGLELGAATAGVLLLLVLAIVVLLYFGIHPMSPPLRPLVRRVSRLQPAYDALVRVEQQTHQSLRQHPAVFLQGLALSVAIEVAIGAQYWVMLHAFAIDLTLPQLGMVILGSGLARATPAPASLGALEASQVALLGTLGVAPQFGFVVGAVLRLHETLWLAVAALLAFGSGVSWRTAAPTAEVGAP